MKSIVEGPFQMGTMIETLVDGVEGALNLGPGRDRVFTDLSLEEKDRFTKLINDMRNIKMTMLKMQLNLKFVNNMLLEWGRFITEVKLNRGLKESNFDQLYAYLKQHEYSAQSSSSPQSSHQPSTADNLQNEAGFTPTNDLIESLTNMLSLLTQSYKAHLPQTNNRLKTSLNTRNKATVQDGRVVVQDVHGRVVSLNPSQSKPIKCYNYNGIGHIARECPQPKRPQDSNYFKDKMLLMQAYENGAVLDEEQLLFLAGEHVTNFDDDVDDPLEQDLALNVDYVFEADQCDAFNYDVDEAPTTQTMFMVNLSSEDPIYDEYVEDKARHVVQSNVSFVQNDALMMIIDEMHEQGSQSMEYEKRAKFELTEREQKIDQQMRIIISDRNRKETSLNVELHYVKMQLRFIIDHNKSIKEEVTTLKKVFKQKEDNHLEEFLNIKALTENVKDRLFKQDQSVQTVHMLCKPKPFYDEKKKVAIGYKNPFYHNRVKQDQSTLYNGNEIVRTNYAPAVVHDSEDTLEIAEETRLRMHEKVKSPMCVENKLKFAPPDYSKENYLATFTP
nr:hypothetical protein [Tanacetum cinerariifolium]